MGLAFLPWERLPAYVLGPLLWALGILQFVNDSKPSIAHGLLELAIICFGAWLVWARFKTGEEPLWSEEQLAAARRRRAGKQP